MYSFKEILFDLMEDRGISITKLSKDLGIDDAVIYDYKNLNAIPLVENAVKIANYFDCTLNYLIGIDDNPKGYKFKKEYDSFLFLGRYLKLLKDNKISHYKFCKNSGVNESSLALWRKGSIPKLETLSKIAKYFYVSIDYLIGRADKE